MAATADRDLRGRQQFRRARIAVSGQHNSGGEFDYAAEPGCATLRSGSETKEGVVKVGMMS